MCPGSSGGRRGRGEVDKVGEENGGVPSRARALASHTLVSCECVFLIGCVLSDVLQERGCSEEVVIVAALLSVDSVFLSPPSLRDKVAATHRRFHSPHGDHMTLLAVYHAYRAASRKKVCVSTCVFCLTAVHRLGAGKTLFISETYGQDWMFDSSWWSCAAGWVWLLSPVATAVLCGGLY